MRWEYTFYVPQYEGDDAQFDAQELNALGMERWEAVAVIPQSSAVRGTAILMKRQFPAVGPHLYPAAPPDSPPK
jgi:hypothetical protein